jgi:hypothetical protein
MRTKIVALFSAFVFLVFMVLVNLSCQKDNSVESAGNTPQKVKATQQRNAQQRDVKSFDQIQYKVDMEIYQITPYSIELLNDGLTSSGWVNYPCIQWSNPNYPIIIDVKDYPDYRINVKCKFSWQNIPQCYDTYSQSLFGLFCITDINDGPWYLLTRLCKPQGCPINGSFSGNGNAGYVDVEYYDVDCGYPIPGTDTYKLIPGKYKVNFDYGWH